MLTIRAMSDPQLPYIPPDFILELAGGHVTDPDALAERFGIPRDDWEQAKNSPAVRERIAATRSQLERSGHVEESVTSLMYMDVLGLTYIAAKQPDADPDFQLRFLKTIGPYTRMARKKEEQVAATSGFTININVGGKRLGMTFGGEAERVPEALETTDLPALPVDLAALNLPVEPLQ